MNRTKRGASSLLVVLVVALAALVVGCNGKLAWQTDPGKARLLELNISGDQVVVLDRAWFLVRDEESGEFWSGEVDRNGHAEKPWGHQPSILHVEARCLGYCGTYKDFSETISAKDGEIDYRETSDFNIYTVNVQLEAGGGR